MRRVHRTLVWVALAGCGPSEPAAPQPVEIPQLDASETQQSAVTSASVASPGAPLAGLPACCKDWEEIKKLDGKRVVIEGTYARTAVYKRHDDDKDKARELDRKARTVEIRMGQAGLMLEVYYSDKGKRDTSELERFDGKKVRVVGKVLARTPDQMHGDIPMQTMTNPSIVDIESITLAGSP